MGVLNCLVTADTGQYDTALAKAGKTTQQFREKVKAESANISNALNEAGNLSGLGGMFSGWIGKITGTVSGMMEIVMASRIMGVSFAETGFSASAMWSAILAPIGIAIGLFIALSAVVAGLGVSLVMMASKGAASIKELSAEAMVLGFSTEQMAGLEHFGDNFQQFMLRLQRGVEHPTAQMEAAFNKLGLSSSQFQGPNQDWAQNLRMVAEGYRGLTTQADRANVAFGLGGRAGMGMIEDLSRGAEGIDRMMAKAERFALTFTEEQAAAVRAANREWKNFGMAFDGIGRQMAILLAPVWEAIGKVGGQIGEFLVNAFRQATPYIEQFGAFAAEQLTPIWEGIKAFGNVLGEMFIAALPALEQFYELVLSVYTLFTEIVFGPFLAFWRNGSSGFVDSFKAVVPWLKIGLEVIKSFVVAFTQIVRIIWDVLVAALVALWDIIKSVFNAAIVAIWGNSISDAAATIKEVMLGGLAVVVVALTNIRRTWEIIIDGIKIKWLEFVRAMVNMLPQRVRDELADWLPSASVANMTREIDRLRAGLTVNMRAFGDEVRAQIARWNFELGGGLLGAARGAANAVAAILNPITVGLLRAQSGHGAVTRNSEQAFSMLFGTRGTQDYYQRLMAERQLNANMFLRDIQREFAQAPAIRRARF